MNKKIGLIIIVLLALSLLFNIAVLVLMHNKGGSSGNSATGFTVNTKQTPALMLENDTIEISKTDLTKCCSFVNQAGKEDGCYVLKQYGCTYCSTYCK